MADVIYKKGQSSNLDNVQIKEGQILVTEDTGEMYIDVTDSDRKKINDTNLKAGSSIGSTRSVGSKQEDSSYKLGSHSMSEGLNTLSLSAASHAEGIASQSGSKAFTIIGIDKTNNTYTLDSTEGLEIGDVYSAHVRYISGGGTQAENYGKITNINGNVVTVDNLWCESTFDTAESYEKDGYDSEQNTFRIVSKPNIGTRPIGDGSHNEGINTKTLSKGSHAEGNGTVAFGSWAHSEGKDTQAGYSAHSEGRDSSALGFVSHAEGSATDAIGYAAHSEGDSTKAVGHCSHTEGLSTEAQGSAGHTEGAYTKAFGDRSHAEGSYSIANGNVSHAEGSFSTANGVRSHVEGYYTIADGENQHVQGKYNIKDDNETYAHVVGNGENEEHRSNAHTLDWNGNAWYQGDVYVGSTSGTNKDEGSEKLASEKYVLNTIQDEQDKNNNIFSNAIKGSKSGSERIIIDDVSPVEHDMTVAISFSQSAFNYKIDGFVTNTTVDGFRVSGSLFSVDERNSLGIVPSADAYDGQCRAWMVNGSYDYSLMYSLMPGTYKVTFKYMVINRDPSRFAKYDSYKANIPYLKFASFDSLSDFDPYLAKEYKDTEENENLFDLINTTEETWYEKEMYITITGSGRQYLAIKAANFYFDVYLKDIEITSKKINYNGLEIYVSDDKSTATVYYADEDGIAKVKSIYPTTQIACYYSYELGPNIDCKYNKDINTLTFTNNSNILNGSGEGSIRSINSSGASGYGASSFGVNTDASGWASHAEGRSTIANGIYSHAEGYNTKAPGNASHAEGFDTKAPGDYSHAEGHSTIASRGYSHAEGYGTKASGSFSHAEGSETSAEGSASHAEGEFTNATGHASHAEGMGILAEGEASHAEGCATTARGDYSHAGGNGSLASHYAQFAHGDHVKLSSQTNDGAAAFGRYNDENSSALFAIGNGSAEPYYEDAGRYQERTITYVNGWVYCDGYPMYVYEEQSDDYFQVDEQGFEDGRYQEDYDTFYIRLPETRKNAFEVFENGHAEVQTMGNTDKSVATKGYVDGKFIISETEPTNVPDGTIWIQPLV